MPVDIRRRSALVTLGLGGSALSGLLSGCARLRSAVRADPGAGPGPRLASAEDPIFYVLHVDARGLPGEILINDVPVERVEADNLATATAQVNMWIAPGRNSLRVRGHLKDDVGGDAEAR